MIDNWPLPQLKKLAGTLTIHSVNAVSEFSAEIIVRSKAFGWIKFTIELSPQLPHHPTTMKAETIARFWIQGKTDEGERRYCLFGSGGTFLAMIAVYPGNDLAVVAATNIGLPAMPIFEKVRDAIFRRMKQGF